MTSKQKKKLAVIIVGSALLVIAALIPVKTEPYRLFIFLVPYLVAGSGVLIKAFKNICHGQIFDENFLMSIATIGALFLGDYAEASFVMLFYLVGELFESIAVGKSRKSVSELMDIRPDSANVERNGEVVVVSPEEAAVGEVLIVKPGEKIPLDAVVTEGSSSVNTSALTGESIPRDVTVGDELMSGCVNGSGMLRARIVKEYGESTVTKILELVENSSSRKSKAESFITRFARVYTPAVIALAVLIAVIPPLFFGGEWSMWIERALTMLVISCPCALVISVPLSFFGGIGGAAKNGILIKGSSYMSAVSKIGVAVFDKTGTLTKGSFKVTAIHPDILSERELLELAVLAEYYSNHPVSDSLKSAYAASCDPKCITSDEEIAGHGVISVIDGKTVAVGNRKLMDKVGAVSRDCHHVGTIVHIAVDGEYQGHIIISDEIKPSSETAIKRLRELGVEKSVMLTGDSAAVGEAAAKEIGMDEVYSELLPADKVSHVETLLSEKPPKSSLAFIGDGINDAPVLSLADVGIAMGALGSDAAIEAADVVLIDDDPRKVALAIKIARKTISIVTQNIAFALFVKAVILAMTIFGATNMWLAVFADVGVSVIAILNATRTLRIKKDEEE